MSNLFKRELHRSKYRLLGLVGQGQFGRVYCASHRKTGKLVALKELDRQRFSTHNFLRELRFLLSLQHENIVTCRALEQTKTGRYLVMDYCEAGTLRNLLDEDVRLNPIQGLKLVTQVLVGLEHAHRQEIIHCDIKPENILLTVSLDGWVAKISDFGIARLNPELSATRFSNTGSPAYMAPERFYGQHSPASDLYAVGVVLFEVLTGHRPFSGSPGELMSAHLNQMVKLPDRLPSKLRTTILTALQKLPARRFRSATEMLHSLQAATQEAEQDFSQAWASSRLLRPCLTLPKCSFQFIHQELLQTPVQQLIGSSGNYSGEHEQIYRVFGDRVGCQILESSRSQSDKPSALKHSAFTKIDAALPSDFPMTTVRLSEPVLDLIVRPQGCFAVTPQAIYLLSPHLFYPETTQPELTTAQPRSQLPLPRSGLISDPIPQVVAVVNKPALLAVEAEGRWMATATLEPNRAASRLNIWNLQHPDPFRPAIAIQSAPCFQILALDTRHFATVAHATDQNSHSCITGVLLEFFSRRGDRIGSLNLPIPLRTISLTSTPYRLLATEPGYPNSVLFLELKPLRIQRIGLNIAPSCLTITQWGYVLMDAAGQIVLLNQYGQGIGQIDGPAHPTAIAALDSHKLLISTWNKDHGNFYIVDLQQLDLDIVF